MDAQERYEAALRRVEDAKDELTRARVAAAMAATDALVERRQPAVPAPRIRPYRRKPAARSRWMDGLD